MKQAQYIGIELEKKEYLDRAFLKFIKQNNSGDEENSDTGPLLFTEKKELIKWPMIKFYSKIGATLDKNTKETVKWAVIRSILALSRGIVGTGLRPSIKIRKPFNPGMNEIDLEMTLENYYGKKHLDYNDIVSLEKKPKKFAVTLMLDISNSMNFEKISIAAIAIASLSYKLQNDYYSIISFNENAEIIKPINKDWRVEKLVDKILNLKTGGLTNINQALEKGLEELNASSISKNARRRTGILVTDGWVTEGPDPKETAKKFERLHVIEIPPGCVDDELCYKMAKLGKERYIKVRDFFELTRIAKIV